MRYVKWGFGVLLVTLLLLASPLGRVVEGAVNADLAGMHQRQLTSQNTAFDRLQCRLLYGSIVWLGGLRYPEGAAIIDHYLHGGGSDLYLPAGYIRRSPVVRQALATLALGQTKVVTLRQQQDWRLSYALNPFRIRRKKNQVVVFQWIVFDSRPAARTVLDLRLLRFTVPDGLIHVLHPQPFMVYCVWKE